MKSVQRIDHSQSNFFAEINVTPLVDIALVLLVVLIVTAPVMHGILNLDLPKENTVEVKQQSLIMIEIGNDRTITLNQRTVSDEELITQIQVLQSTKKELNVHLYADKNVRYEDIIRIMALLQRNGISNIGFVTDQVP